MFDLREAIKVATERMKKYRSIYEQNEMAIRSLIIESDRNSLLGENSIRKKVLVCQGKDTTTYGGWTISCRWQDYRNR